MSEIESRVKSIIVEKFGVEESMVTSEASFTNDLGADSLDTVELIMEIEDEFGISIPDDLAEKVFLRRKVRILTCDRNDCPFERHGVIQILYSLELCEQNIFLHAGRTHSHFSPVDKEAAEGLHKRR